MDVQEEAMGSSKHMIMKGKRAKRQRTVSPLELTMATSSSCSSAGEGIVSSSGFDRATTSPSNSGELVQSCIEEEDMANCLILLAQGQAQKSSSQSQQPVLVAMTTSSSKSVVDVYQCKTCNRCFPSFQALGGHRASHKKPKVTLEDKKPLFLRGGQQQEISTVRLTKVDDDATLSLQIPSCRDLCSSSNNKSRIHECSICGAEFTSGQALGGHMRRHRPLPTVTSTSSSNVDSRQKVKKPRTLLSLDLNLPAPEPEDDHGRESKYSFASKEQVIVFPASSLVDCHY